MRPLITLRGYTRGYVSDLLWPALTETLQVRINSGETIRWRGLANVVEIRRGEQEEAIWALPEPADCVITDRRLIYLARKIKLGTGPIGTVASTLVDKESSSTSRFVGQVRFEWPASVTLIKNNAEGVNRYIQLLCQDHDMMVKIILSMSQRSPALTSEQIAAGFAHGLVGDIARYRVAARARQLDAGAMRQLTSQRDNPVPDPADPNRWRLPGGIKVGLPADSDAYRKRFDALLDRTLATMTRYEDKGKNNDLDAALMLGHELIEDSVFDGKNYLAARNFYAGAVQARYDRFGDITDLTTVINLMRGLISEARLEAPEFVSSGLSNLGSALTDKWHRTLNEEDLTGATAALEEAITRASDDQEDWALAASHLSEVLRFRYPLTEDLADLDRAIELCEEIHRRTKDLAYLPNLGHALLDRHRVTAHPEDLERAISVYRTALEAPHGAANRATLEMALADARKRLANSAGSDRDRQNATRAWRSVCEDPDSNLPTVLQAARAWATAEAGWGNWAAVAEACDTGLSAAERLWQIQLGREHKSLWLEAAAGLPALAAYAQAKLGQSRRATVTLEHGRTALMSEALASGQADLQQLSAFGRADLCQRYEQVARRLADLESLGQSGAGRASQPDRAGGKHPVARFARDELDGAIAAIRHVPGFETFLARPDFDEILSLAGSSNLAYIAYTDVGGIALLLERGKNATSGPTVIWLDGLTESAVSEQVEAYILSVSKQGTKRWLEVLDDLTRWLWDTVMGPLISSLSTSQVMLIPGGVLGLLPLHIAWREDSSMPTGRRYALDDALITYAPSAAALLRSSRSATGHTSIMAVADTSLKNSVAEVQAALHWFDKKSWKSKEDTPLNELQDALRDRSSVLHFSCHGYAETISPFRSRLLAASDGDLTLQDIYECQLSGTRLAVLSACETSVPGAAVPDEAIGFPSGLVQAGVQGVIGSLWQVGDAVTRALMTRFYELWRRDNVEPSEALRQAQQWVRDSSVETKKSAYPYPAWHDLDSGWRPPVGAPGLIHAHPTYWGAFQYVGT
jgi:CHAT domain-containing protein/tetratricopeptide (TPR) repeat protein